MQQTHMQEEKQEINPDSSPSLSDKQHDKKEPIKQYFSTKCKWISFSVTFFVLAGIGIFLGIYLSQNTSSAPTLKKFQRDEFQQVDEICMHYTSDKIHNCTQIEMKTKRVVNDVNEQNATSLLMLTSLKVKTFQQNSDGTRQYDEMIDQNTEIEEQIKKSLRRLQKSQPTENDNFCEGIPADECGNVNEVPLVTVITDQQTGAIQQIGIPIEIPDLLIQPLVSNIIHIAPNVAESTNTTGTDGNRLLNEDYSNIYYIGKERFIPKSSKTKSWFGNTVIKKTISQSDKIDGNSQGINIFDMFEQSQETILDNNNYLVSSHITTDSKYSNSIQTENVNQNSDDLADKSETEITNDSNLITVETKSDEELTNILTDIQNKQTIQYYTIQDLQDKIQNQQDQQDQVQDLQQEGNRLLENENGDVHSNSETEYEGQEGECTSSIFNQKRTLKEATVLKQKVGLQAEFKGEVKEGNASGFFKTCVSLNGGCVVDLYKRDFSYQGKPLEKFEIKGEKSQRIFSIIILIMGYPVTVGADYNYSWGFIESPIKTENEFGISQYIYASLSVTAYGELNLVHIIYIRAGVQGYIFKGSANGVAQFMINQVDNVIIPEKYIVFLDFQIESLTFDVYASYQHITFRFARKCFRRWRFRICWYVPQIGYSNWSDVYRKSFQLANFQAKKRIFEIKSKCY
ncbi:unnamed protein product [Paramecium primaurelia]|uniref:Transmembrane protein n=1 Tax=Paramecium primaurelia TaxID=5886 RepID=A0A8S1JQB7_PARPR|nr:unnamed protein product [Paramecium primaurelia]